VLFQGYCIELEELLKKFRFVWKEAVVTVLLSQHFLERLRKSIKVSRLFCYCCYFLLLIIIIIMILTWSSIQFVLGVPYPEANLPGREAAHSTPSSAEVKGAILPLLHRSTSNDAQLIN
jgi:hypothetical protein